MENLVTPSFWKGRNVLVTGHTGFKGSWLCLWLKEMGAKVTGVSLPPPTQPALFDVLKIDQNIQSHIGDIRDLASMKSIFQKSEPEIVLHLAAQPLVRLSYEDPIETYSTNVMGTLNILEACRLTQSVRTIVIVTTDKCYENKEWIYGYREIDPMGGYDPYSSSKGCTELLTASYRSSYFHPGSHHSHKVGLASARAGNVIGGGDWAKDRLVPDIAMSFINNKAVQIRNPHATRPWQHVLSPLSGYLRLAEKLSQSPTSHSSAFNFGPNDDDCRPVGEIVTIMAKLWGKNANYTLDTGNNPHEAGLLKLDSSKAKSSLGWRPKWDIQTALRHTVEWYQAYQNQPSSLTSLSINQIREFSEN